MVSFLLLITAVNSYAGDIERLTQLEKEVQELKQRLTRLESSQAEKSVLPKAIESDEGWKNLANWRLLKRGMTGDEVRSALGEPKKIDGGHFTEWYYPNNGRVVFTREKVYSWNEP
jgi:hypothetical protein